MIQLSKLVNLNVCVVEGVYYSNVEKGVEAVNNKSTVSLTVLW
jgi:hypothetical protein